MPGILLPNPHPYGAVVSPSLAYAGVDQGIDFTGAGDIYALADGIVTRVMHSGSGWPGQGAVVNYQLTSGPAKGQYVYVAEDFAPAVKVGQRVKAGDVIGHATGSGQAPGIEIGWAQPSGIPLAPRPAPRPASQYTPQGESFLNFVRSGATGSPNPSGGSDISLGGIAHGVNSGLRHIPGVAQVEGVASGVSSVADFLGKLTDPHYILRGLQIVAGAVLVLAGIVLLTRQVALAADLPDPVGLAAATASKTPTVPVE